MKKSTLFRILLPIIMMIAGSAVKAQGISTLADLPGAAAVYCSGETVKMLAASTGATTYTWLRYPGKDLTGTPVTITGSTTVNLTDVPPGSGYYTYVSTGSNTNCTSDPSLPTTIYALPVIKAVPTGPTSVCVNSISLGTTTLTANATNTDATNTDVFAYTYQWKKNGTTIASATNSTYTLDPTADAATGSQAFTVQVNYVIRNTCSPITSTAANVDVQANPTKPTVTIVP
jgi:hypothetical protein